MKILVISDLYPPYFVGGYELNCRDTVDALRKVGHQVTVLTSKWGSNGTSIENNILRQLQYDPSLLSEWDQKQISKLRYFEIFRSDFKRITIARQNYKITKRIISKIQPDIVYFWHLACTTTSPAACVFDLGVPACIRIEDYSFAFLKISSDQKDQSLRKRYKSLVIRLSECGQLERSHLVVNSQAVKDFYSEVGFLETEIDILYDGLPADLIRHPDKRTNPPFANPLGFKLGFIGRIHPEKGPDIAIKALAILRNDVPGFQISLSILGTGNKEYVEDLKKLSHELGIEEQVFFLSKQPPGEVLKYYQELDALLFTSRWQEPFSRVVLEAMAQGLPIVAARSGGTSEIITDQENGLLVPKDDPHALCDGVKHLLSSPEFAAKISRNAFDTIVSRYTIEQVAAQTESILTRLISTKMESRSGRPVG